MYDAEDATELVGVAYKVLKEVDSHMKVVVAAHMVLYFGVEVVDYTWKMGEGVFVLVEHNYHIDILLSYLRQPHLGDRRQ